MNWPSDQLAEIARRRERLTARAAVQRAAIAGALRQWEKPLGSTDRILRVVRLLRAHPLIFGAAVTALVALPRGRLVSLVGRGIEVLSLWRSVEGLLAERRNRDPA